MNKYNNKKVEYDGYKFDSIKEMERYAELQLLVRAGEIDGLILQPRFLLQEGFTDNDGNKHLPITYVADFQYCKEKNYLETVEDTKGMKTDVYKIKKKLFLKKYPQYRFIES